MLPQCLYIFHSTLLCHQLDYTDPTSCVKLRDFPHAATYGSLANFRRPSTTSGSALSRNVVVRISFYLGKSLKTIDTANTLTERLLNKPLHVSIFFACSLYCFRLDFVSNPLQNLRQFFFNKVICVTPCNTSAIIREEYLVE